MRAFRDKTPSQLRDMVLNNGPGPVFRRAFLLFAMMACLLPSMTPKVSPKFLPLVVDIEHLGTYNWSRHIFEYLFEGMRRYKESKATSLNGCVYVLQILYFHFQMFGSFDPRAGPPPPWINYWSEERLEEAVVNELRSPLGIVQGESRPKRLPRLRSTRPDREQVPATLSSTVGESDDDGDTETSSGDTVVSERQTSYEGIAFLDSAPLDTGLNETTRDDDGEPTTEAATGVDRNDESENTSPKKQMADHVEPNTKCESSVDGIVEPEDNFPQIQMSCGDSVYGNVNIDEIVKRASRLAEDSVTSAFQPNKSIPSFSLNMSQLNLELDSFGEPFNIEPKPLMILPPPPPKQEDNPHPQQQQQPPEKNTPPHQHPKQQQTSHQTQLQPTINPHQPVILHDETPEIAEAAYKWLRSIKGSESNDLGNLKEATSCFLTAADARSLLPRNYINSNVVNYACFLLNTSGVPRFNDVYCMTPTLLPAFFHGGRDDEFIRGAPYQPLSRDYTALFLTKDDFKGKKLIFLPLCWREHWFLYAFDVTSNIFYVLDPMHTTCPSLDRARIDTYAMTFLLDLMRISDASPPEPNALPNIEYANLPGQPNAFDCGIFVIKWMELWSPTVQFDAWDDATCALFRKEVLLGLLLTERNDNKFILLRGANKKMEDRSTATITYQRRRERKPGKQRQSPYVDVSTSEIEKGCKKSKQRTKKV